VHEHALSGGVHTCHTPHCMNFVPVLLTWHSPLYSRQPLHKRASYNYGLFLEGWARYREHQRPAEGSTEGHSFSQAPPFHVLRYTVYCIEALSITIDFKKAQCPKVLSGQVLNLCQLGYLKDTVLNAARAIITVCMEFMHVFVHFGGTAIEITYAIHSISSPNPTP
jgi:hypothetical protein